MTSKTASPVPSSATASGGPAAEGQESYVLFDVPTEAIIHSW